MDWKLGISVVFLLALATASGSESQPAVDGFRAAITGYVYWMERVSNIFVRQPVETMNMHAIEEEGETVHDILTRALKREASQLNTVLSRKSLSKSVLKSLEQDFKDMNTATVIGLVLAHSPISNQGARMAVATKLFSKMTIKMKKALEEFQHSPKYLKKVSKLMSTSEIALDTMVSSFKLAEQFALGKLSHHRAKRQVCTGLPNVGSRTNLGGGFSTDGSSLVYNHGQTTVVATPHFNVFPKPEITGGQIAAEHRFQNFPGTLQGHVTVDGSGNVQNAGVQIKIDL